MKRILFLAVVVFVFVLTSCTKKEDGVAPDALIPRDPPVLADYLAANPTILAALNMESTTSNYLFNGGTLVETNYNAWSDADKTALSDAFIREWNWLYNTTANTTNLGTDEFTMPVTCSNCESNLISSPSSTVTTTVNNTQAKTIYFAQAAHSLALEAGGDLGWSVAAESAGYLHHYFNSRAVLHRYNPTLVMIGKPTFQVDARIKYLGTYSPATPRYIYAWLKNNNILQSTRTATITALLQWARVNMSHYYNSSTYQNVNDHWGYPSDAPVSRIIEGTNYAGDPGIKHWTQGCHGTAAFMKSVLRAVNIPMEIVYVCGHSQLYFPTEGKYVDHADNPYNSQVKNSSLDISGLLIDQSTHTSWFSATPDFLNPSDPLCSNIGRKTSDF